MKIVKELTVEYAHRLFYHKGACANLHGHTGRILVELWGQVDPQSGMVVDFKDLKILLWETTGSRLDHHVVLNQQDQSLILAFQSAGVEASLTILPFEPTAENLALWVAEQIRTVLPIVGYNKTLKVTRVTFYETATNYAIYE